VRDGRTSGGKYRPGWMISSSSNLSYSSLSISDRWGAPEVGVGESGRHIKTSSTTRAHANTRARAHTHTHTTRTHTDTRERRRCVPARRPLRQRRGWWSASCRSVVWERSSPGTPSPCKCHASDTIRSLLEVGRYMHGNATHVPHRPRQHQRTVSV